MSLEILQFRILEEGKKQKSKNQKTKTKKEWCSIKLQEGNRKYDSGPAPLPNLIFEI